MKRGVREADSRPGLEVQITLPPSATATGSRVWTGKAAQRPRIFFPAPSCPLSRTVSQGRGTSGLPVVDRRGGVWRRANRLVMGM